MDVDLAAIERIQQGDESGLRELMVRHKEAVFHFAYRYTGNESDAAELTEETFYRVYTKASAFRPRAKVRTWIFTIAANLCRDFLRRQKKRKHDVSLDEATDAEGTRTRKERLASHEPDPGEMASGQETLRSIQSAVQGLPHKLRFPFVFCVLEDHSQEDCAAAMGVSTKAVETRIYRARNILRHQLDKL